MENKTLHWATLNEERPADKTVIIPIEEYNRLVRADHIVDMLAVILYKDSPYSYENYYRSILGDRAVPDLVEESKDEP